MLIARAQLHPTDDVGSLLKKKLQNLASLSDLHVWSHRYQFTKLPLQKRAGTGPATQGGGKLRPAPAIVVEAILPIIPFHSPLREQPLPQSGKQCFEVALPAQEQRMHLASLRDARAKGRI